MKGIIVVIGHIGMGSAFAAYSHHPFVLIECPGHVTPKNDETFISPEVIEQWALINYRALCPVIDHDFVLEKTVWIYPAKVTPDNVSTILNSLIPHKTWYHPLWGGEP